MWRQKVFFLSLFCGSDIDPFFSFLGRHKAHVKMLINHNAHLDIQTPEGETALELIAAKVPSAIKEFEKRLDKGIRLEDPGNETKILLDFRKLFSVK